MPSPLPSPPGPLAWSVAVHLRHRGGLEIRAAAENVLPGWGRGGERLTLLLRLRRRLLLAVTSQCGTGSPPPAAPSEPRKPCKILRFLRSRWARVPRVTFVWRRKKKPPARAELPGRRAQKNRALTRPSQCYRAMAWTPAAAAALRFVVAALAVVVVSIAVFRLTCRANGLHAGRSCWSS